MFGTTKGGSATIRYGFASKQQRSPTSEEHMQTDLLTTADLHLHTTYSDGTASVPETLERAAQLGLQVIAITDHDEIAGAREAARLSSDYGVAVVVGEEVSTAEGHLLALFIDDWLPPGRPAAETIAAIHAQGGLAIAAHPYDWAIPSLGAAGLRRRLATDWPLDAIEVFNASLSGLRSRCNRAAQRAAADLGVPAIAGSDAHSTATIGRGVTSFAGNTVDDLYRAIRSGQVQWSGACWRPHHYAEVSWLMLRRRGIVDTARLMLCDLPLPWRKTGLTAATPALGPLPADHVRT